MFPGFHCHSVPPCHSCITVYRTSEHLHELSPNTAPPEALSVLTLPNAKICPKDKDQRRDLLPALHGTPWIS